MPETITTLRIEDVYPHPKHYREVKSEAVKTLAKSIEVAGQLEPIRVFKDGDIYIIDAGHHRHAAMQLLGRETIEAIIVDAEDAESTSATIMVASNMHFPETELERSRGTQLLLSTGVRPLEAAALVGEDQDRMTKVARGMAVVNDETACEDLTTDRLVAIQEFEDDPEVVERILKAPEATWRREHQEATRARKLAAAVDEAERIIAESGCELIERVNVGSRRYLDRCLAMPEGALYARIETYDWQSTATIVWYADASPAVEDPEAAARREEADRIDAELEAAAGMRLAHIAAHIDICGNLRRLAIERWEAGESRPDVDDIKDTALEEVKGFTARITCAVLAELQTEAGQVLGGLDVPYYVDNYGPNTIAYLDALAADGYAPTDVEAARYAELVKLLEPKDGE